MDVSEIIKQKRKEANITQDQMVIGVKKTFLIFKFSHEN